MKSKNYLVKHITTFVNKIRFYLIFNKNQLWKCQKKRRKKLNKIDNVIVNEYAKKAR